MEGKYMTNSLSKFNHSLERKAFSIAINKFLKNLDDDKTNRTDYYLTLVDYAEKFWGKNGAKKESLDKVKAAFQSPDNRWVNFINKVIDESNPEYLHKMALNLGYEAFFRGTKMIRSNREKYGCNIPWLILFDPTMACNMHCVGCWSGTYGHKVRLSFEEMDKIVTQGKELGVYLYMMTGGEPMCAKNDILKLCEKHNVDISPVENDNPGLLHAKAGAIIAKEEYDTFDEDILNAIRWHTTGREEMSAVRQDDLRRHGICRCRTGKNTGQERAKEMVA